MSIIPDFDDEDVSLRDKVLNVFLEKKEFNQEEYADIQLSHLTFDSNLENKMTYDLSTKMDFVYDQGSIGSCVSNSACWILRYHKMSIFPSRLYHYYYCRLFDFQQGDNRPNIDDGTTIQQGFRVLNRKGTCIEGLYPYITSKQGEQPPATLNQNASFHRVIQYAPVRQDISYMKNLIKLGYPFSFGILVYQSFVTNAVTRTGIVPMPQNGERILGGHALTAVGYDDSRQMIKFVNSWGRGWGERGYGYIPYAYLENGSLSGDIWTAYKINMQMPRQMKKKKNHPIKKRVNPITYGLWLRKHKH